MVLRVMVSRVAGRLLGRRGGAELVTLGAAEAPIGELVRVALTAPPELPCPAATPVGTARIEVGPAPYADDELSAVAGQLRGLVNQFRV